jgi:hypothetical protein
MLARLVDHPTSLSQHVKSLVSILLAPFRACPLILFAQLATTSLSALVSFELLLDPKDALPPGYRSSNPNKKPLPTRMTDAFKRLRSLRRLVLGPLDEIEDTSFNLRRAIPSLVDLTLSGAVPLDLPVVTEGDGTVVARDESVVPEGDAVSDSVANLTTLALEERADGEVMAAVVLPCRLAQVVEDLWSGTARAGGDGNASGMVRLPMGVLLSTFLLNVITATWPGCAIMSLKLRASPRTDTTIVLSEVSFLSVFLILSPLVSLTPMSAHLFQRNIQQLRQFLGTLSHQVEITRCGFRRLRAKARHNYIGRERSPCSTRSFAYAVAPLTWHSAM